ncbi:MAG: hypothetical protein I8H87_00575 [Comamonadaceae bacterium]|nr:hypothetical protein [Comamonadaceae bacterium]
MSALAIRSAPRRAAKPKADPRFLAVADQVKAGAARLKKHAPAAQKAREASKAAKAPPNEQLAGAKARAVDEVKDAPTPKPQPQSFKAQLRAEIDKAMPKTLGDTEKFMDGGAAGAMKGSLEGGVAQQKNSATGPVDAATKKPPNAAAVPAQPSAALPAEPAPQAPPVDGACAMPSPATPTDISLEASKKDTSQALADEKIKPQSLQKANDPRFSAVAGAQAKVAAQADKAPAGFRGKEAAVLADARAKAGATSKRGTLLLAGSRGAGNARVMTRQQQQAAKEEAERKQVATHIEGLYAETKVKVERNLATLDTDVSALFDPGIDAALAAMKTYVDDRIFKYKLDRYLTIPLVGLARWVADQALGLPEEVNAFYVQGRRVFQTAMDRLIDRVASLVEMRLAQAKADVAAGQQKIKTYVASLPAKLKATGDAAQKAVSDRFTELSASIDEKKDELASALASKYKEAFDKADEALKQMQDENKGLVQQFAEKLGEVIKALMEFKAKLLGLIKKGQETIQLILDDPIGFLGNLLAAVKGGFNAFVSNIWTHLKAGFMKWLFGSLAAAGITLPADLSLPSILKLVLDVLGITYDKMRAKAVKLIGERAVSVIEKAVEYIKALIEGGPAKLWEKVKEDLSDLKDMVIGAIQDWLIETVVKQAVTKVVSMFNPAGAIVQAVIAIYDVVMFVIEKAQQIMALVEAVVNSVYAIATGAIGGAISWIEKSLASAIPLVIGFLARLIGLGGISEKIKGFIKKVQAKVDQAIDKAIAKVVALVKKLFGSIKAGAKKLIEWWKKKLPFSGGGEKHTLQFDGSERSAKLAVHSKPKPPKVFIQQFVSVKGTQADIAAVGVTDAKIVKTQGELTAAKAGDDEAQVTTLSTRLDGELAEMTAILQRLLVAGDQEGSESNPVLIDYPKRRATAYVPIYVGPRVGDSLRLSQTLLGSQAGKSNPDAKKAMVASVGKKLERNPGFKAWTGMIELYSPMAKKSLGNATVGLSPQFASLSTGMLLTYGKKEGTGGGGKINDRFKPYGFVPSSKGGEGLDGDHVLERQIGGPDELDNLWPLHRSENRSSGATVKSIKVKFKGEDITVHVARDKLKKKPALYLLVRSTKG